MKSKKLPKVNDIMDKSPVCVGTGLMALDIVMNGDPKKGQTFAGGSCGNIISILSFLGWETFPIARFSKMKATDEILIDLNKWNVNKDFIFIEKTGSTPIIIHRIYNDKDNNVKHRFEFKVPGTGKWLPGYKSILRTETEDILAKKAAANVFFFDRVSRAALDLAYSYKKAGSLIFFEPSSIKEDTQFKEAIELADIIKFSSERIRSFSEKFPEKQAFLEVETLGSEGLLYRTKKQKKNEWKYLSSLKLTKIADSAGAGDWCSAGIIHMLGKNGAKGLRASSISEIETALEYGQLLGAANCLYEGARGLMYNSDLTKINNLINSLKANPNLIEPSIHVERLFDKPISFNSLLSVK
ncbi:MAG: hypothetical protein JST58_16345 [Bacteroidetes bacterium]|nr:hypothetical protein [Bacteroidota bacterium]